MDNLTATANGAVASMTVALAVGSTAKILLVFASNENTRSVSTMAFNGTTLTRLGGVANSSRFSELWAMTAPPVGTFNLVTNWTGAGSMGMVALSYNNVKAVGSTGTVVAGSSAAATAATLSLSSTTTDLCVALFAQNSGANTLTINNGTTRKTQVLSATTMQTIVGEATGAPTLSFSATSTGSVAWTMLGVPLIFSAAAATLASWKNLMGVGQ